MAIRNYDIGGMLARSGQSIGQQISQGVDRFGQGIGGLMTGVGTGIEERGARIKKEKTAQEVQQLLKQYANNTAQLNALGQKYDSEDNNEIAKLFYDAAKKATDKEATGQQRGVQGGLMAITQGASRGVPLVDLQDAARSVLAQGGTQAQITEAYKAGKAKPDDIYKVVGNRIFNTQTGQYVEPSEAADLMSASDLSKVATSESVITYLQTGREEDLVAKPPEGQLTEQELIDQQKKVRSQILATDSILDAIDDALGLTDEYWAATYDLGKFVPLTDSRSLENYVKEIQANLAFDKLQNMRDNSKTGGALGQVSNIELDLLKSSLSALDPADANFSKQLQKVRRHYETFKAALLGQKPPGDRYIELDNELYYVTNENEYEHLGEL